MLMHIIICMCLTVVHISQTNSAVTKDEVKMLPGLNPQPMFRHYSGYLNATNDRSLHYWFVESASNPSEDPVVLWLNGGPGCSSMEGILNENGPFKIGDDGITIHYNKYSWNNIANVLYLEAPAGVGYSFSADKDYRTNDGMVSRDNYFALLNFFTKFPEFRSNPFFITGESYGGIYVPTLSSRVVENSFFNFKGFAVGNGLSSWNLNDNSLLYYGYYHGILSVKTWQTLMSACCKNATAVCDMVGNQDPNCVQAVGVAMKAIRLPDINMYNLFAKCFTPADGATDEDGRIVVHYDPFLLTNDKRMRQLKKLLKSSPKNLRITPPCVNVTALMSYMNHPEVRTALHIPSFLPEWEVCSGVVGSGYTSTYRDMVDQYKKVLASNKRILVYNGDADLACNFLGDEWFVNSLGLQEVEGRKPWFVEDSATGTQQIAGFVRQLKNLVFTAIKGAGHMVPQDKPHQAFEMFRKFVEGNPF